MGVGGSSARIRRLRIEDEGDGGWGIGITRSDDGGYQNKHVVSFLKTFTLSLVLLADIRLTRKMTHGFE